MSFRIIALSSLIPAMLLATAPVHGFGGPPAQAYSACTGMSAGAACSFQTPRGTLSGSCRGAGGQTFCVPTGGGGGRGPGGPGGPGGYGGGYEPNAPYSDAVELHNKLADTGQVSCFTTRGTADCATVKESFPGQDGHYRSRPAAYRDGGDGTVTDLNTGLTWQQGHNARRLGFSEAAATCGALTLGGYDDWRLPTIKELFSITHWQGATGQRPFIDTDYFKLEKPGAEILVGDRYAATHNVDMMGQTWSSTVYTGTVAIAPGAHAFFFNFLDGRIKSAPVQGRMGLFYRCVRGPEWGENQFRDNGDGSVSDGLTGLMWQQADDGQGRNWGQALAYCEGLELAGHDDWRLPNVKELQTIVDYRRNDPAIDPRFFTQRDRRGWFWSSTTHGEGAGMADYVCFGKCTSVYGSDVHGAGAQRSDPKVGDPSRMGARGGQQDESRVYNYARCVRDDG